MSEEEIERALRLMDKKEREWLDSRKDRFKNINNMVDDLEKDKKVQKVVETFSRWQDPTIEKLQQENKQLKEVIEEVRKLLDKSVVIPDKEQEELWWTGKYLCCGDELINRFYEILDKAKDVK